MWIHDVFLLLVPPDPERANLMSVTTTANSVGDLVQVAYRVLHLGRNLQE